MTEPTRIESADALMIAADAAGEIVKRANLGGTNAVTYDGVRDAILAAMKPLTYEEDEHDAHGGPLSPELIQTARIYLGIARGSEQIETRYATIALNAIDGLSFQITELRSLLPKPICVFRGAPSADPCGFTAEAHKGTPEHENRKPAGDGEAVYTVHSHTFEPESVSDAVKRIIAELEDARFQWTNSALGAEDLAAQLTEVEHVLADAGHGDECACERYAHCVRALLAERLPMTTGGCASPLREK